MIKPPFLSELLPGVLTIATVFSVFSLENTGSFIKIVFISIKLTGSGALSKNSDYSYTSKFSRVSFSRMDSSTKLFSVFR